MKHLIQEIRNQPDHIRELLAGLCTVIVVTLVGVVWFNSFQHNIYALLNPDQETRNQEQLFAGNTQSLFGSISQTIKEATSQIGNALGGVKSGNQVNIGVVRDGRLPDRPHPLPVQGNK